MSGAFDEDERRSVSGQAVQNGRVASLLEPRATARHQPRPQAYNAIHSRHLNSKDSV